MNQKMANPRVGKNNGLVGDIPTRPNVGSKNDALLNCISNLTGVIRLTLEQSQNSLWQLIRLGHHCCAGLLEYLCPG